MLELRKDNDKVDYLTLTDTILYHISLTWQNFYWSIFYITSHCTKYFWNC